MFFWKILSFYSSHEDHSSCFKNVMWGQSWEKQINNTNCLLFISLKNSLLLHTRVTCSLWGEMSFFCLNKNLSHSYFTNIHVTLWEGSSNNLVCLGSKTFWGALSLFSQCFHREEAAFWGCASFVYWHYWQPGQASSTASVPVPATSIIICPRSSVKTERGMGSH